MLKYIWAIVIILGNEGNWLSILENAFIKT